MSENADVAYAAGFFDGEGHVGILAKSYIVQVITGNTYRPILLWHQERWGGKVYTHKLKSPIWRPDWQWHLHGKEALAFLEAIQPYIKVKANVLANGLTALRLKAAAPGRGRFSPEMRKALQACYEYHRGLKLQRRLPQPEPNERQLEATLA